MKAQFHPSLWAAVCLGVAAVGAVPARAQQTESLAPPIVQPGSGMWHWQETPRNERIPIVRAVFDQSGYQLYDENGQVIAVPFEGNNLYVMQFGRTNGEMYFVNEDGRTPTLYVPNGGYLENASVGGARWYPFPANYFYVRPVYLGPAPTWDSYISMGWYPGMVVYGGYWHYDPWRYGVTFRPTPGLYISIGGRVCRDWDDYVIYYRSTPSRRVVFVDRPTYRDRVVFRNDRGYVPPHKGTAYGRPVGDGNNDRRGGWGDGNRNDRNNGGGYNRGGYDRGNNGNSNGGYDRSERRGGWGDGTSNRNSGGNGNGGYVPPRRDDSRTRESGRYGDGGYSRSGSESNGGRGGYVPPSGNNNGNRGGYDRGNNGNSGNNSGRGSYEAPRRDSGSNRDSGSRDRSVSRDNGGSRDGNGRSSDSGRGREERRQR